MRVRVFNSLAGISADTWNRLGGNQNPFVRHEFLLALETSGCVQPGTGWHPQHLLLEDDNKQPIAAAPLYLKSHSYGEYVFDWAWADAYERNGLSYFPKLISAVPFSPVTGPRILATKITSEIVQAVTAAARALANETRASSIHWLFTDNDQTKLLVDEGYLQRTGYQYHWHNNGYSDFDNFVAEFSAAKRKKVRRERRRVREQGIQMEIVEGSAMTRELWHVFHQFYESTILNHGAIAYLNEEFFVELGRTMPDNIVMVFARQDERLVAGALNLKGENALFGRYWGSLRHADALHFETCYYSAIEYCIDTELARFEAGAQGGHKLSRGFLPSPTYSAHWLQQPEFSDAVEHFLQQEQNGIEYQLDELNERSPFKQKC